MLDPITNGKFVDRFWQDSILPSLFEYVRIPNKSPMFDPDWEDNGFMDDAVNHMITWVKSQNIDGLNIEVHKLPWRTPTILL